MHTQTRPNVRGRLTALLVGPVYLLLLSSVFSSVTQTPYAVTLGLTLLGASVIMVVLAIFGVKVFRHPGSLVQFTLSTVLLILIPLSIYLAALRWLFQDLPIGKIHVTGWLLVTATAMVFIAVSTAVLIWFAEAIVWLALIVLRTVARNSGR
jgi:hypothetical protein